MSVALVIPGRRRAKGVANPKRYLRKGNCAQCGWCCQQEECPHLTFVDGKYYCDIYYSDARPIRCKLFPEDPPIRNEKCGYFWLDRWENDKIVKAPKDMM